MSGFNTIKKSRKRSHEIEEKLNVLNRELEKTKDIQEQPTVNTGDLYTKVQQSEPSDFQGPLDVPSPPNLLHPHRFGGRIMGQIVSKSRGIVF